MQTRKESTAIEETPKGSGIQASSVDPISIEPSSIDPSTVGSIGMNQTILQPAMEET